MRLRHFVLFVASVFVIGMLFLWPLFALAAVPVCTDAGAQGKPICAPQVLKPKSAIANTDLVLFCATGDVADNCATLTSVREWHAWGGMQDYSWTLTDAGWLRKSAIPDTAAPPPPAPVAWHPKPFHCPFKTKDDLRGEKGGNVGVVVWFCDTPTGLTREVFCGDPRNVPDGSFTMLAAALFSLFSTHMTRPCTAAELALVDKVVIEQGPRVVVAPIAAGSRPIYSKGPNNTLGPPTGLRANVLYNKDPMECGWNRLQDASGAPTNYFEALKRTDTDYVKNSDGTLVVIGYTLCTITGLVSK
jgi:hypothetical protein